MSTKFSQFFKLNVVGKAINGDKEITIEDIAKEYGIAHSTVGRWIRESRHIKLGNPMTNQEKRPQDWNEVEKLQAIIDGSALDDEGVNNYCRQKGVYAYHIKQWKQDFIASPKGTNQQETKHQLKALKEENRQLKQELNRKEKALAETAALLVLKKKSNRVGQATRSTDQGNRT